MLDVDRQVLTDKWKKKTPSKESQPCRHVASFADALLSFSDILGLVSLLRPCAQWNGNVSLRSYIIDIAI